MLTPSEEITLEIFNSVIEACNSVYALQDFEGPFDSLDSLSQEAENHKNHFIMKIGQRIVDEWMNGI